MQQTEIASLKAENEQLKVKYNLLVDENNFTKEQMLSFIEENEQIKRELQSTKDELNYTDECWKKQLTRADALDLTAQELQANNEQLKQKETR